MMIMFYIMEMYVVLSSIIGTTYGKIELWLLGGIFLSVVGIYHGTVGCNELVLSKGGVDWQKIEGLDGIVKGTYDGTGFG